MEDIIWKAMELKHKIKDPDLLAVLRRVLPIYSTSDFLVEIAGLGRAHPEVTVTGMGSFLYQNNVLFQYIPKNKRESAKIIYESLPRAGFPAPYDFAVVDNKHANSFCLIFLHAQDSFANYARLQDLTALSDAQRCSLFQFLAAMAEEGVFLPWTAISRHKETDEYALLDYSEAILDRTGNAAQKQAYIAFHRKLLQ